MTLDMFQEQAARTNKTYVDTRSMLLDTALGLNGESGEVADIIKKHVFHGHELSEDKLVEELGDVLWYVSVMAYNLGKPLSEIAAKNVEKLCKRYPNGFSVKDSVNREEYREQE